MKTKAKRTVFYHYPVELVWRGIGVGGEDKTVDPLNEEQYENSEPERGTVFTRAIEVKQNEVFAFQMKTWLFFSDWRIELTPIGPCETKVRFINIVKYRSFQGFIYSGFGALARSEVKQFSKQLLQKIESDFQKNRPAKED